jgi:hypothetical protein
MKKISVISSLLIVILITALAFTFNTPSNIKESENSPRGGTVHVRITGCNDCSGIGYCIDNGTYVHVGECDFTFECSDPIIVHTICVRGVYCTGVYNQGAGEKFKCPDDGSILEIKIDCSHPCDCTCDNLSKKKK